jgi:hypothetical protein
MRTIKITDETHRKLSMEFVGSSMSYKAKENLTVQQRLKARRNKK